MKEKKLACILIDEDEISRISPNMRKTEKKESELRELLHQLKTDNYTILDIKTVNCREDMHRLITDAGYDASQCLLLTSQERSLKLIDGMDIASVGIELPLAAQNLSAAQILVQGFEEVDEAFLIRIWQRQHKLPWTIFTTERTYVREMTLDDLDALYAMYKKPGMTDYMEPLYAKRQEEYEYQRAYIDHMYWFYGYGMWLVFERDTDRLIGRAGLDNREIDDEIELELGYAIDSDYQGQGYATEVCMMVMEYAREALDFPRLNCLIHKDNAASIALARKLGFHPEGEVQGLQRYVYKL